MIKETQATKKTKLKHNGNMSDFFNNNSDLKNIDYLNSVLQKNEFEIMLNFVNIILKIF